MGYKQGGAQLAENNKQVRVRVSLWVVPGEEAGFAEFEEQALRIMKSHGVEDFCVIPKGNRDDTEPYEIHEITFPSRQAFSSYRADPALLSLADLRKRSILRTEVEVDEEG